MLTLSDAAGDPGGQPVSESMVLEPLRAIRGDIASLKTAVGELKERVGVLEGEVWLLSGRMDRMGGDVEQIRRRLDLVDTQ